MKTIEERAYKFAKEYLPTPDGVYARSDVEVMMKNCAIQIAIEQRQIDIEKAIECTCRICNPQCMPEFKKCDFDKNKCRKIALLRKAMEEE